MTAASSMKLISTIQVLFKLMSMVVPVELVSVTGSALGVQVLS